jgi:hypothetical protein
MNRPIRRGTDPDEARAHPGGGGGALSPHRLSQDIGGRRRLRTRHKPGECLPFLSLQGRDQRVHLRAGCEGGCRHRLCDRTHERAGHGELGDRQRRTSSGW